jgi:hypothetical protein
VAVNATCPVTRRHLFRQGSATYPIGQVTEDPRVWAANAIADSSQRTGGLAIPRSGG